MVPWINCCFLCSKECFNLFIKLRKVCRCRAVRPEINDKLSTDNYKQHYNDYIETFSFLVGKTKIIFPGISEVILFVFEAHEYRITNLLRIYEYPNRFMSYF